MQTHMKSTKDKDKTLGEKQRLEEEWEHNMTSKLRKKHCKLAGEEVH